MQQIIADSLVENHRRMNAAGNSIKIDARRMLENAIMIIGALIVLGGTMGSIAVGRGKTSIKELAVGMEVMGVMCPQRQRNNKHKYGEALLLIFNFVY